MQARAVITTPFPTVRETAREMRVGQARLRWLERLMTAIARGREGQVMRVLALGGPARPRAKRETTAGRSAPKRRRADGR